MPIFKSNIVLKIGSGNAEKNVPLARGKRWELGSIFFAKVEEQGEIVYGFVTLVDW